MSQPVQYATWVTCARCFSVGRQHPLDFGADDFHQVLHLLSIDATFWINNGLTNTASSTRGYCKLRHSVKTSIHISCNSNNTIFTILWPSPSALRATTRRFFCCSDRDSRPRLFESALYQLQCWYKSLRINVMITRVVVQVIWKMCAATNSVTRTGCGSEKKLSF